MSHPPLPLFAIEPLIFDDEGPCAHAVFEQAVCALGIADTLTIRPMASILIDTSRFPLAEADMPETIIITPDEKDTVTFGMLRSSDTDEATRKANDKAMEKIHAMAHEFMDAIVSEDDDQSIINNIIHVLDDLIDTTNIKQNYLQLALLMITLFMRLYGMNDVKAFIDHLLNKHLYDSESLMDEISDFLKKH